jgi:hypothetical protein
MGHFQRSLSFGKGEAEKHCPRANANAVNVEKSIEFAPLALLPGWLVGIAIEFTTFTVVY